MTEKCEWPGCENKGLCSCGQFLNKVVCERHFNFMGDGTRLPMSWEEIVKIVEMNEQYAEEHTNEIPR